MYYMRMHKNIVVKEIGRYVNKGKLEFFCGYLLCLYFTNHITTQYRKERQAHKKQHLAIHHNHHDFTCVKIIAAKNTSLCPMYIITRSIFSSHPSIHESAVKAPSKIPDGWRNQSPTTTTQLRAKKMKARSHLSRWV